MGLCSEWFKITLLWNECLAGFKDAAIASGAGEARLKSRSQKQAASVNNKGKLPCEPSTSFRLLDE
ncbi:hypothetical protein DCAR_0416382 [Daucus carota subsp. sativus]|uniref:Uncharacterized protein n=1 Tax=Daucus carota subsp. sativus TaxID=79200 RepID=A0A175Y9F4_DAUCS|nr:hypothetical protein DCAR_0416382 [Daucus carota subsp. sativus]